MLFPSRYGDFTKMFCYCLNYPCVCVFINVRYFFLSTCQAIMHCLPSMVLFVVHRSYRLTTDPYDFIVFTYRSYHNIAESIQPYTTFNSLKYSTSTPFTICTFPYVLGSPLTWCPKIHLQYLIWWIYLLSCQNWGILQGHKKCPRFLHVSQW